MVKQPTFLIRQLLRPDIQWRCLSRGEGYLSAMIARPLGYHFLDASLLRKEIFRGFKHIDYESRWLYTQSIHSEHNLHLGYGYGYGYGNAM